MICYVESGQRLEQSDRGRITHGEGMMKRE